MTPLISDACVDVEGQHFEHHPEAYRPYKLLVKIISCRHSNAFNFFNWLTSYGS